MVAWCLYPDPLFYSCSPVRMEPLADASLIVRYDPPLYPNMAGPSQPPVTFVDGIGYMEKDCEVGRGKVTKAPWTGEERVVWKIFQFLFNPVLSEELAENPNFCRRWQSNRVMY